MLKDLPAQAGPGVRPSDVTTPLILDFLRWLAAEPRTYAEVMDAWRTSCPRLTVWEDALDGGYVKRRCTGPGPALVEVTPHGLRLLAAEDRVAA
jgi:hypothetical protein